MSGLLFLTSKDFYPEKGQRGPILSNVIQGFSLILFYSTQCEHCATLIPIFKRLPGTISGIQFGLINVSTNRQVISLAKNTICPIKYVPYIVLYISGKPFMEYKGPYDAREIRRFVLEVAEKVQKKQQFSDAKVKDDKKGIPEYSLGKPNSEQYRCYLDFEEAYKK